ncbi:hypothetical protein Hanom_Chr11g01036771 [Helianthus anomalus]
MFLCLRLCLVLKSERRTKATRSKIEAQSAKAVGFFVPEAQDVYIFFLYIPYISHRFLASFNQNIAISKAFIPF